MVEPTIVPRAQHTLSRRDVDPDALKVLYRLKDHGHIAYLVGGGVRDLLLGRRPKDFDIGTSAHPYEIKKLFRNCWIIGRRFRLAHVKFGTKTIEVATFRRQIPEAEADPPEPAAGAAPETAPAGGGPADSPHAHHQDTFGTPEEDAFRRDFTVNALFYDIATFSIIDYVGGLKDLEARLLRSIGAPDVRFHEDPVRMLRAVVLATRLGLTIDPPTAASIRRNQALIGTAAPARLLEEYFKILRSGAAEATFAALRESGLLRHITPELHRPSAALTESLRALDEYRARFATAPETLTNSLLVGTLLSPLGLIGSQPRRPDGDADRAREPRPSLGILPIARRDVERLRQIAALRRRLADLAAPPRAQRNVMGRPVFGEALLWLEIHGRQPELVEHWRAAAGSPDNPAADGPAPAGRRRRRRRRRRARRTGPRE
jgi:poly(A) polymerase